MADVYKLVYRQFKKAGGGGADGHVVGLNCSINVVLKSFSRGWNHGSKWKGSPRFWLRKRHVPSLLQFGWCSRDRS
jgi:hypothetical protein